MIAYPILIWLVGFGSYPLGFDKAWLESDYEEVPKKGINELRMRAK